MVGRSPIFMLAGAPPGPSTEVGRCTSPSTPGIPWVCMVHWSVLPINPRSLALDYRATGGSANGHVIAAARRNGTQAVYNIQSATARATLGYSEQVAPEGTDYRLSTPAVGDIDGDGDNDIVVATRQTASQPGGLFAYDENSGNLVAAASNSDWRFGGENTDRPVTGPALADLDGDGDMEVILADRSVRVSTGNPPPPPFPVECRVGVFDRNGGSFDAFWAADSVPYTRRNDGDGAPGSPTYIWPTGTPIVGDFDCDGGASRPDIVVPYSTGAICAFEFDSEAGTLSPKPGWPLLLPDVAREPVLVHFGDPAAQASLVVQARDGWVHVYDLPTVNNAPCDLEWPMGGADGGNTRSRLVDAGTPRLAAEDASHGPLRIVRVSPEPMTDAQELHLAGKPGERVVVGVYDVIGRRIRRLYDGSLPGGTAALVWDGRNDDGVPVASGLYWYAARGEEGVAKRKVVYVRR